MKNAELIALFKFESNAMRLAMDGESVDGTYHLMNWLDKPHRVVFDACKLIEKAADAIEALEAQLKNASVAAIAEAAEVDRMKAEVERLTTLAHGQHIELYNARLKLAAAQAQEPVAEITEVYTMTGVVEWKAHTGQPIYVGHKLFAAPIPQQPAPSVPEGWKLVPIEPTEEMICAPPNAWPADAKVTWAAMLAAAPQPKEKQ